MIVVGDGNFLVVYFGYDDDDVCCSKGGWVWKVEGV